MSSPENEAPSTRWYRQNKERADARAKVTAPIWRKNNPEKAKAIRLRAEQKVREDPERLESQRVRKTDYRRANPEAFQLSDAKRRARDKGLEFTLTKENIPMVGTHCPIFGTLFERGSDARKRGVSPALDRIDNTKGYTPDNVWFISHRANRLKGDGTAEEHAAIAKALREKLATSV